MDPYNIHLCKYFMVISRWYCLRQTNLWHPSAQSACGAGVPVPPVSDGGSAGPNPQAVPKFLWAAGPNWLQQVVETNQSTYDRIVVVVVVDSIESSPGFRSMKSTMLSPSLTAPKSSTTRAELRTLHVLTSSLLKWFNGTWGQTTTNTQTLCPDPSKYVHAVAFM